MLLLAAAFCMPLHLCRAKNSTEILKRHERNSISLDLEFSRKNPGTLQKLLSLMDPGPNGYATGFFVGSNLVLTAYHVVSGNLDITKRRALGFDGKDPLVVKVFTNGCQAKVLSVDKEADLALLQVCGLSSRTYSSSFQSTVTKDEKLLLIANPHGEKVVGYGTLNGSYPFNGIDYWSVKISARDGFSGSPVYNEQGEIVGVFSGYDWGKKLAVISPGARAQKLLKDFSATQP
jgi:S1-C subfamily serine protease